MDNVEVKVISNKEDLEKAFSIRIEVFVEEQGVPLADEVDKYDDIAERILVYYDKKPVGTARWRVVDDMGKLERVCVLAQYRKYGLGKVIVNSLEKIVEKNGLKKVKLHGQTKVAGFYEKLGYKQISDEFIEDGIKHVIFVKDL